MESLLIAKYPGKVAMKPGSRSGRLLTVLESLDALVRVAVVLVVLTRRGARLKLDQMQEDHSRTSQILLDA